jgi:hypothetical protein
MKLTQVFSAWFQSFHCIQERCCVFCNFFYRPGEMLLRHLDVALDSTDLKSSQTALQSSSSSTPSFTALSSLLLQYPFEKSQDENPRSQQSVNLLYCMLSMITTCFGLRKRPFSGHYHVIQNIKKKVTTRCNGSIESNSKIIG